MKFTKLEARYLVQSARDSLRWARRYESTIKTYLNNIYCIETALIRSSAAVVDAYRRDAAERMKLAKEIEAKK